MPKVIKMLYGWANQILRVDLTRKKIVKQPFPKSLGIKFIGGAGINAKILYDEVGEDVDPFSPENKLILGAGALAGTLVPCSTRLSITSKGPFTFAFSDSNVGGFFAPELKWAGYEHVVIQGRAKKPLYLWIDDDTVKLRSAKHLSGKNVLDTDKIIKEEVGDPKIHTASIGVAGENLVRYAIPMIDLSRAPGWGGAGAIMGSKNLKAIAVRGTKRVRVANATKLRRACEKIREIMIRAPRTPILRYCGRAHDVDLQQEMGASGVKNFQEGLVPPNEFPNISSDTLVKEMWADEPSRGCFNCPIRCTHRFLVKDGPYAGFRGEKIEYNQLADAKLMGIYNVRFVARWAFDVNLYGLDTDAPANAIAWAMECYEKGILTPRDTDGLEVTFGNEEVAFELLEKIAYRKGKIGNLLAEGTQLAAKKLGKASKKYAMVIKGARMAPYDPRMGYGSALAHAVSTRGADHLKGMPMIEAFPFDNKTKLKIGTEIFGHPKAVDKNSPEGKGHLVKFYEDHCAIVDSLGICKTQTRYISLDLPSFEEFAELLSLITGIKFTAADLKKAGERIITLERAFNAKCGLTRKNDTFPDRFFQERIPSSPLKVLNRGAFEKMKNEYFKVRGWDISTGNPKREKLKELGLGEVIKDIEKSKLRKSEGR